MSATDNISLAVELGQHLDKTKERDKLEAKIKKNKRDQATTLTNLYSICFFVLKGTLHFNINLGSKVSLDPP